MGYHQDWNSCKMLSDFSFILFAVLGKSTQEADIAAMILRRMANTLDSHHSSENTYKSKQVRNKKDEHSCSFCNHSYSIAPTF